jgi:hypothetical protein
MVYRTGKVTHVLNCVFALHLVTVFGTEDATLVRSGKRMTTLFI